MGDLIEELQDAINEESDEDIIDSFAIFLQVDFTFVIVFKVNLFWGLVLF